MIASSLAAILSQLDSVTSLEKAGFVIGAHGVKAAEAGMHLLEDEIVEVFGAFSLALASCRLKRGRRFFAPPFNMVSLLGNDVVHAKQVMANFKHDARVYEELKDFPSKTALQLTIRKRHAFQQSVRIAAHSCLRGVPLLQPPRPRGRRPRARQRRHRHRRLRGNDWDREDRYGGQEQP